MSLSLDLKRRVQLENDQNVLGDQAIHHTLEGKLRLFAGDRRRSPVRREEDPLSAAGQSWIAQQSGRARRSCHQGIDVRKAHDIGLGPVPNVFFCASITRFTDEKEAVEVVSTFS